MTDRRKMQFGDWINGAALLAIGVLLGVALGEWLTLEGAAFWFAIVYIFIPFGFVFLLILLLPKVFDYLNYGVKPAAVKRWERRKPLALFFFVPAGVIVGVVGAQFGLAELLL